MPCLVILFRLNLRKANSTLFENATGRNNPDFSRTIPCLTCGMRVPLQSIDLDCKGFSEKTDTRRSERRALPASVGLCGARPICGSLQPRGQLRCRVAACEI